MARFTYSNKHQELDEINLHYSDVVKAIRLYFNPKQSKNYSRFSGYSHAQLKTELEDRIDELDHIFSLNILSALEAAFRMDFQRRIEKKMKDFISIEFRSLYEEFKEKTPLDSILDTWKNETIIESISKVEKHFIGEIKGAFKYRHWLAHGRYWEPKLGRKYDYVYLYEIAELVFDNFPFEKNLS